jgi:hypothetical protein
VDGEALTPADRLEQAAVRAIARLIWVAAQRAAPIQENQRDREGRPQRAGA